VNRRITPPCCWRYTPVHCKTIDGWYACCCHLPPSTLTARPAHSLHAGRFAPQGARANDGTIYLQIFPTLFCLILSLFCVFVASKCTAADYSALEPSRPQARRLELGTVAGGDCLASMHAAAAAVATQQIGALFEERHDFSFLFDSILFWFEINREFCS
jgi:hypothetical protein